ncbi:MAG: alpha-amylase [Rheinheimera sp.]|uniref:alpha-amylase family protein n=1 Tax=Arsukibacterium sp. UBA3155 TaxID=1946058 RepID=UPI000C93AC62|nr:alpha-amylase family protein [Arsukibacterium sp. UBA3155]MAD75581.1 alpha-amylase [Rheinheimera sp.]|tara:strand:+ start:8522 stop:10489 length:1968 start_codon:yes stop_codon:yes gene_type:complete
MTTQPTTDIFRPRITLLLATLAMLGLAGCGQPPVDPATTTQSATKPSSQPVQATPERHGKPVVYQVFTRLFGNTNSTNKPWGTTEENGVGKFNDFTDDALAGIKALGTSHIWYTGVPHHAVINDYTAFGISLDDPDVVKGRAGSPYAVKDYYSVNPDLAVNPANRLAEFKALIELTHRHDMQVIIDIVPNHVARDYQSLAKPDGVSDFGANDDSTVEYARNNNFYYVPGKAFQVPQWPDNYQVLGGEPHPLADGQFSETPAKWTGNGARAAQPAFDDWYETVKINYGVRPDGSYDFDRLPSEYAEKDWQAHYQFWQGKDVPDSWVKFRDITLYWLDFGVDGFRYDMAEMVPVEFWSYLNSHIKQVNPNAFLLAEVYQPDLYRDYIKLGLMDYLYDKVEFYDSLKRVMQGSGPASALVETQQRMADIEHHMLHFLENHDEQRIASPDFAGDARKGMPAMVVSALISTSPTMLYFGQDVGEPGAQNAGFGQPTRTSIFDYVGVPHHQRWMNGGKFDGGALTKDEAALRDFYVRLMQFSATAPALLGDYYPLHSANLAADSAYSEQQLAFARYTDHQQQDAQQLIVVSNFNAEQASEFELILPSELVSEWQLADGSHGLAGQLGEEANVLQVTNGIGRVTIALQPLDSVVYRVQYYQE